MENFEQLAEAIAAGKTSEAKEAFERNFGLKREMYGQIDTALDTLGFKKADGIKSIDHLTGTIQGLAKERAELASKTADFEKKLSAFGEKETKWGEIENKFKADIEASKTALLEKENQTVDIFLGKLAKSYKFAEAYQPTEQIVKKAIIADLKGSYTFTIKDGDILPMKDGNPVMKDGKILTIDDIFSENMGKFAAVNTGIQGGQKPTSGGTPHDEALATGLKVGTKEYFDFVRLKTTQNK